jgi:hypothetical protein
MKERLADHLMRRLSLRGIKEEIVREVYAEAEERFYDEETKNSVAVKKIVFKGKERDMMVAYEEGTDEIILLTIHPLKKGQKENRVQKGRWTKL